MKLSDRVGRIAPSPTLALNQRANALRASGKSVINLTTGEPDFPTPKRICQAAYRALEDGKTKYTPASGISELRDAVCKKFLHEYGRTYKRSETIITIGAKQALFNLCQVLIQNGDEALILAPYWVSYSDMVRYAGGTPQILQTHFEDEFKVKPSDFLAAITPKTKLVFLNSPSNPTGSIYSAQEIQEIAEICAAKPNLFVVTDDIYQDLIYDGAEFASIGKVHRFPQDRLLIVSGVSKSYAMTGWRIGFSAGPEEVIQALGTLQSQSTSGASSVAQWAALEAIEGNQSDVSEMRSAFKKRRDFLVPKLNEIPGVTCHLPKGAFYVFPRILEHLSKKSPDGTVMNSDIELAAYLLETCGVATVPGTAFGAPGYLRMSYGASIDDLQEGISRISKGLQALSS